MMKRVFASCIAALFMVCGLAVFASAGEGPETVTFDTKKKVVFPHHAHQAAGIACADCHHSMADGKQVAYVEGQEIKKCGDCHNKETLAGKMKGKLALDTLKGAGHGNCKECHDATKDKPELKKCGTCHPK